MYGHLHHLAIGDSVAAMYTLYDPSPYQRTYWGVCITWGWRSRYYLSRAVSGARQPGGDAGLPCSAAFHAARRCPMGAQVAGCVYRRRRRLSAVLAGDRSLTTSCTTSVAASMAVRQACSSRIRVQGFRPRTPSSMKSYSPGFWCSACSRLPSSSTPWRRRLPGADDQGCWWRRSARRPDIWKPGRSARPAISGRACSAFSMAGVRRPASAGNHPVGADCGGAGRRGGRRLPSRSGPFSARRAGCGHDPARHVLAIDQGTTSTRGIVFGDQARTVATVHSAISPALPGRRAGSNTTPRISGATPSRRLARPSTSRGRRAASPPLALPTSAKRRSYGAERRQAHSPSHCLAGPAPAEHCARLNAENLVRQRTGRCSSYFSGTKVTGCSIRYGAQADGASFAFSTIDCSALAADGRRGARRM